MSILVIPGSSAFERVEGAAPRGPLVGGGIALPPVLGDRVLVYAVPPRDLAEVRLRAGPL